MDLVLVPGESGTAATIDAGSIEARDRFYAEYGDLLNRAVLGCGCTERVECGYHREQSARVARLA